MIIRPETPADFAAVARLNVRAFGGRIDEALVVALLRGRAAYTPALSLIADMDGAVVGQALFTPFVMPLMSDLIPVVLLAPLAVDPDHQRRGIGGALLEAAHAAARTYGAVAALLLGHEAYYPRFGYQTHAFGVSTVRIESVGLPPLRAPLHQRAPTEADLPALMALWTAEEGAVDVSVRPEASLVDWLSPNPQIAARVFERDGVIVGYTRVHAGTPAAPRLFLAADADAARRIAHLLADAAETEALVLPLHPASASAHALGTATVQTFGPAMALSLVPRALDAYFEAVRAGQRVAGRPLWPTAFDLA